MTWDEAKRIANLKKHGLDFVELQPEFFEAAIVAPARQRRLKAMGRSGEPGTVCSR